MTATVTERSIAIVITGNMMNALEHLAKWNDSSVSVEATRVLLDGLVERGMLTESGRVKDRL